MGGAAERLPRHHDDPFDRLLIAQAIGALSRSSGRPDKPVLLLLDEFAALGRLTIVVPVIASGGTLPVPTVVPFCVAV